MQIVEEVKRECCQTRDLLPIEGSPKRGRDPEYMFCRHCGAHHRYSTFMDAAGSRDWHYVKMAKPFDASCPTKVAYHADRG